MKKFKKPYGTRKQSIMSNESYSPGSDRSSDEYELLSYLLNEHEIDLPVVNTIRQTNQSEDIPLSFTQQRLWFIEQYENASNLYLIRKCYRITGKLNKNALDKTFSEIVKRHKILRTQIMIRDGIPYQSISDNYQICIPVIDNQHLHPEHIKDETYKIIRAEISQPFDLTTEVFRFTLIRIAPDEHWLLLIIHHIIFDGWSQKILFHEIRDLYNAFTNEKPSPLPDLPVQYIDFTLWQQEWSKSNAYKEQLLFWKHRLEKISPLDLPTDFPRPPLQTYTGASRNFHVTDEIFNAIVDISKYEGVTLFMSFLAGYMVFLTRFTGQDDICVGTPVSGRNRIETEKLIGLFINTLVLRANLSGNPRFSELLKQIKNVALDSYDHQDIPFERIVTELNPARDLSRPPIIQTMFIFEDEIATPLELRNLKIEQVPIDKEIARFELTLTLEMTKSGIMGNFKYNSDLFSAETINQMADSFLTLLSEIASQPNCRIGYLPLLPESEIKKLIYDWNKTNTNYPNNLSIQQLFAHQVKINPNSPAVIIKDKVISFQRLDNLSNQIAYRLHNKGIGPGKLVGICLERSLEMISGLVGIFKSGGGYVPLDPTYNDDLLRYIIQDAGLEIIITQRKFSGKFSGYAAEIIDIDEDSGLSLQRTNWSPRHVSNPKDIAYVIYTSGSTGKPKGVMVEQKSLVNYVTWVNTILIEKAKPNLPTITKLIFDASIKQVIAPLLRGDPVWIIPDNFIENPHTIFDILKDEEDGGLNCVPTYWSTVLEIIENERVTFPEGTLSYLLLGGENLQGEIIEKTYKLFPQIQIWNLYGPTETTANATVKKITPGSEISIGRPISNTQIYILDMNLQLVPVGVPGNLFIGGDGVARGYLNNPRMTAKHFVPNPFSSNPGARLYHTGDKAAYQMNGDIKYIGRTDRQIKIRGYRVELEEIEIALKKIKGVKEAAVQPINEEGIKKRLISYVIPYPNLQISRDMLLIEIEKQLPSYMIPSHFVFLQDFPLTPTGKIDFNALPVPEGLVSRLSTHYEAPRSPIEYDIAEIWAEILEVEQVGIYDNFFDLGGHSLLATMLVSRINRSFQLNLSVRDFFQSPTIEELAARIIHHQQN
jgi:amino acid adenylation domain-containing protein